MPRSEVRGVAEVCVMVVAVCCSRCRRRWLTCTGHCRNAQGRPDLAAAERLAAEESKSKNKMCGVYFECGARNVSFGTVAKDKVVTGGGSSIYSDRSTSKRLRFIMPVSDAITLRN